MLWANMNLLFWLSLVPFATDWMAQNHFAPVPTALYGVALLMPALVRYGLQLVTLRTQGNDSALARAIGRDVKGKISPVLYVAGILIAFVDAQIACAIYLLVALLLLIPDRRIERVVRGR
jgi:TMEM175 potassium channel family protein